MDRWWVNANNRKIAEKILDDYLKAYNDGSGDQARLKDRIASLMARGLDQEDFDKLDTHG